MDLSQSIVEFVDCEEATKIEISCENKPTITDARGAEGVKRQQETHQSGGADCPFEKEVVHIPMLLEYVERTAFGTLHYQINKTLLTWKGVVLQTKT